MKPNSWCHSRGFVSNGESGSVKLCWVWILSENRIEYSGDFYSFQDYLAQICFHLSSFPEELSPSPGDAVDMAGAVDVTDAVVVWANTPTQSSVFLTTTFIHYNNDNMLLSQHWFVFLCCTCPTREHQLVVSLDAPRLRLMNECGTRHNDLQAGASLHVVSK